MECLEARQRAVALLKWHVQPENDRSQEQKDLATEMTRIMERTQRFIELRRNLLEAIWFGKAGVQMHFRRTTVNGYRRTAICKQDDNPDALAWSPVHGDKIVFRNDDPNHLDLKSGQYPFQMGIRIGASWAGRMLPGNYIPEPIRTVMRGEVVDRGLAYFLRPEDRKRFIVHKHMIEDGAYEDLLSAGSIHGVGIRSRIYWDWLQKQQIQGMLIAYIERTHGGIEIYRYPVGNAEAETAVRNSINQRVPGRAALLVPVPMGEDAFQYGVEIIEPGMQGISAMQDLLGNFFGHRIKRYILGQTLSTEADATGLGSGVADLHLESFLQIVEYDATNLEETITDEMLSRLQFNNFPASKGIRLQFKIDTQDADTQKKLEALHLAWEMNAQVPEREVFDAVGISPATENDRVLPGPGGGQGMTQQPHGATVSVPEQIGGTPQPEQFAANGQQDRYAYASREPDLRSAIDKAAAETDTEPSDAQRISGNYRKGQFHWNGWTIAIENPAGSIRRGRNSLGVEWENKMPVHYGYFRRTESDADGDHLDVFVGPDPESPVVFVVDQIKGNGHFDEHKVLIGFLSEKEAIEAYKASYSKGWTGLKSVTAMTIDQFRNWLEDGDTSYEVADQVSKYGQREFVWNEDDHPRNDKGEFVEKGELSKPRRQLRDGQVEMRQAKAGGETSDVDGKFYKGGQWMPVHGLSTKSETASKPPKVEGGEAPVANENARPTARSLSPEQVEAERRSREEAAAWADIHSGPLGKVLGLGPQPHRIKWGHGILGRYLDVAKSFGAAEPRFENVADVARQIAKEYHSKASQDDWDYLSSMIEGHAKDDLEYAPKQHQKYLKDNPSILLARRWIEEAIDASGRDIDSMSKINAAFDLQVSRYAMEWKEELHPRDTDGKFTDKVGMAVERKPKYSAKQFALLEYHRQIGNSKGLADAVKQFKSPDWESELQSAPDEFRNDVANRVKEKVNSDAKEAASRLAIQLAAKQREAEIESEKDRISRLSDKEAENEFNQIYGGTDWITEVTPLTSARQSLIDLEQLRDWAKNAWEKGFDKDEILDDLADILDKDEAEAQNEELEQERDSQENERMAEEDRKRKDPVYIAKTLKHRAEFAERELQGQGLDRYQINGYQADIQAQKLHEILLENGWSPDLMSGSGSTYYKKGNRRLRVSDHEVPMTGERMHDMSHGRFSWAGQGLQIVLPVNDLNDLDVDIE